MRSATPPPGAWLHFSPIAFRIWCQEDPSGASVPIFTVAAGWASAVAAVEIAMSNAAAPCDIFIVRSLHEKQIGPREKPSRPPLHDKIEQPPFRPHVGIDRQRPGQELDEFLPILVPDR